MNWVILNFSVRIKGTNGFTHTPWWVCQSDLGSLIQIILKEGTLSVFFANRCNTTVSLAYDHYNYSIILITPEQYCLARKFSPHKYHFWKQSIVNSVAIVKPTLILVDTRQPSAKIVLCCERVMTVTVKIIHHSNLPDVFPFRSLSSGLKDK